MQNLADLPTISVVIPSFNQGYFIEETIVSVLGQQYPKLEVIIIDGGSTDHTIDIVQSYASQLTYWHSRPDNGQGDAINQGMRLSSGDILCWLNSDDLLLPGTLLYVGRTLSKHLDQPKLIYGHALLIEHQGEGQCAGAQDAIPFDAKRLTYSDYMVQPASFWTRALWEVTGELDPTLWYTLDWEWYIRASQYCHFTFQPRYFAIYRIHPQQKTSTGFSRRREEIVGVVQRYATLYWAKLFEIVLSLYPEIRLTLDWLLRMRVPKPTAFLLLRFPQLVPKLKHPQDVHTVLHMLG